MARDVTGDQRLSLMDKISLLCARDLPAGRKKKRSKQAT